MQQDFGQLREVLLQTVSHNNTQRRQAEKFLEDAANQSGFAIMLLHFVKAVNDANVQPKSQDAFARQAAATNFKNLVKQRWAPDSDDVLPDNDKQLIKDNLLDLMCTSPPEVQRMLSEALSIISKHDFPAKWEGLLPQIVDRMQTQDPYVIHALMMTANSIFKRFRYQESSDALLLELKYVLDMFQQPFLALFHNMAELVDAPGMSPEDLQLVFETLRLLTRIFFSLNWQDIPEFFEDEMPRWTQLFAKLLSGNYPLQSDDDEESGPVERLQAAIVECLNIYATKYDEFQAYLQPFAETVWQLLIRTGREPKFDNLATTSIQFLTSVVSKPTNAGMFNEEILRQFVESIVVPNLTVSEVDEDLFENNPTDYIRKDLEGSDVDTRRRSATELVRGMCRNFEQQTTELCLRYIVEMLQQHSTSNDWKLKDAALQLAVAVAVRTQTVQGGVSQLNPGIDILDMFNRQIFPEVQDEDIHSRPIVKADALKFVALFRSQMPADMMISLLPAVIRFLGSTSVVVQTYAAHTIERFLSLKDTEPGQPPRPRLSAESISSYLQPLFSGLFTVLDNTELPENEYVMKAIMRALQASGPAVVSVTALVLGKLTEALARVASNPRNPHFNHYIFESMGILIKSVCESNPAHVADFEEALFPPFQQILQNDIVEFMPYVFQVFAHLLYFQPAGSGLSAAYQQLFSPCLSPTLWESKGNVPALTELMKMFIARGLDYIVAQNRLEAVLGIFQRLLGKRSSETSAFALITALVAFGNLEVIGQYLPTILQLMLVRMQENKNPRMFKLVVTFLCNTAVKFGPEIIEQTLNGFQQNLLHIIVEQTWLPATDVLVMSDRVDAKAIVVGGARILTETSIRQNQQLFTDLFKSLLEVCDPLAAAHATVDLGLDEEEDRTFDATYSRLAFSRVPPVDQLPDVTDLSAALVSAVGKLCAFDRSVPYAQVIQQSLNGDQTARVELYLRNAGVSWA